MVKITERRRRRVAFRRVTPAPGAVCKSLAAQMGVTYAEPDEVVDREAWQGDARALDSPAASRTRAK